MKMTSGLQPLRPAVFCIPRLAFLITLSLVLITMSTACGKKGPVRPKLDTLPEAPQEVTLQQQGNLFLLGWEIPSAVRKGSGDVDLREYRIKRLQYDAADGCPTCREPQDEVAELEVRYPAPGQRIGDRLYWRDLDVRLDSGYRYAIVPVTVGGIEGSTAMIHLTAQQPPPPPTSLQVEAGDAQVTVQWIAPTLSAEMALVGYNLYRRQDDRPFPMVPVNLEPLQKTLLLDRGLDNGRPYEYRVSSVVRVGEQRLESMAGPGVVATPQEKR